MRFVLACLLLLGGCAVTAPQTGRPAYVVFFTERSAALDGPARQVILEAAAAARAAPGAPVTVLGYTDSAGAPDADIRLSQARARHVADALAAGGVAPARIARAGRGQTGEDPGVASRRVEIAIGAY